MKKAILLPLLIITITVSLHAGFENLIPQPQKVKEMSQISFNQKRVKIYSDKTFAKEAMAFIAVFKKHKISASIARKKEDANVILIKDNVMNEHNIAGAYELGILDKTVTVTANDAAGFFYASRTLHQLLANGKPLTGGVIADWPAFEMRGFMHDLGRNFLPIEVLKEHADIMGQYKMNTFHLHLTDYPGYRLESKKYPILNDPKIGEKNRQPGKFYTVKEMRDFVKYCQDRHITVIPEIDMPGHSAYFNRAFNTDMQSDKGVEILKVLIKEVAEIFPKEACPYLHIGSDEVRIHRKNFMEEMTALIRQLGREVIYWRPGGNPTDNKVITQLWTGSAKPAAGMKYIDSRATYVNHMDPFGGVLRLFFMQPCWIENSSKDPNALGGILASWADNTIDSAKGGYGIYDITPIYAPLVTWSQNLWKGRPDDKVTQFLAEMPAPDSDEFKEFKAFEKKLITHRNRFFRTKHFQYVEQTEIPWQLIGPTKDNKAVEQAIEKRPAPNYGDLKWLDKPITGATVHLQHFFGFQANLDGKEKGTYYAQTFVYSPKDQAVQWWAQFGTPSSSGRRNAANPEVGQWNHYGADFWVNNRRIKPPVWNNPGALGSAKASYKIPYTMEAYFYRKPTIVRLRKGWNRILLKVPSSTNKKSKWMFTCVPVRVKGRDVREVKGLKFSTTPRK